MKGSVPVLELHESDSNEESICGEYRLTVHNVAWLTLSDSGSFCYNSCGATQVIGTWELKDSKIFVRMQSRTLEAKVVYDKLIGSLNSFILEGIWEKVD